MRTELSVIQIAKAFFLQGSTSFGGPAAGLAALESEFVHRRKWISPDRFKTLLTWCKLLPGPVATQLGIMMGREKGGTLGGLFAGLAFIAPAFILVLTFSYLGATFEQNATLQIVLPGMTAAAFSLIAVASYDLGKAQIRSFQQLVTALIAAVTCSALPRFEPIFVIGAGITHAILHSQRKAGEASQTIDTTPRSRLFSPGLLTYGGFALSLILLSFVSGLPPLIAFFSVCFRIATLTFGTGMVVLPLLRQEFVIERGWSTELNFAHALALGQVTPGPIVITSTALGYFHSGLLAALACTFGMFLPSFFHSLLLVPQIEKSIRGRGKMEAFISGALPWIIGSIGGAAVQLAWPLFFPQVGSTALVYCACLLLAALKTKGKRIAAWILIPVGGLLNFLLRQL